MTDLRVFNIDAPHTIFGNGCVSEVGQEADNLGAKKALLVTGKVIGTSEVLEKVKKSLAEHNIQWAHFDSVDPNNPIENVVASAKAARENGCDLIIGVGGGSTMDNAKAASVLASYEDIDSVDTCKWIGTNNVPRRGLPKIMVPTTSGTGSEWTVPIVVMLEGRKAAMRSIYLLPDAAVVDPLLTMDVPQKVTADTGMDALTHAIEAYTGIRGNLYSDMISERAISLIGAYLRRAYAKGTEDIEARYYMSFASMISCNPLVTAGAHLGHGISHALQSVMHNLTHGQSCSLILCAVMEFNKLAKAEKLASIAGLMGENVEGLSLHEMAELGIDSVRQLTEDIGMPQRLRDTGMKKEDIQKVVHILFEHQMGLVNSNPRQCSRDDAIMILESVW